MEHLIPTMSETSQNAEGDGFGLDKDARLEAKRADELGDEKPEPLDPPFPYRLIALDPDIVPVNGN